MGRYGWKNLDGVRVRSGPAYESIANCTNDGCEWGESEGHSFGRDVAAQTARAKRHVKATGHTVLIARTTPVTVEPDRHG